MKLLSLFIFIFSLEAHAENVIKSITFNSDGFSAVAPDSTIVYGGQAGAGCTGDGTTTCNSCTDVSSGTQKPCNPKSIYAALRVRATFQVNKAMSGRTAYLQVEPAVAGGTPITLASVVVTATGDGIASEVFAIEATWGSICAAIGATADCKAPGATAFVAAKSLSIGMDGVTTSNGQIDADERQSLALKVHFLPDPAGGDRTQAYCPTATDVSGRSGMCNLALVPGDGKAYIDSYVYARADTVSTLEWDGVAIFPIPIAASDTSTDTVAYATAFSAFSNGKVAPIIRDIANSDGAISNSLVGGSLNNYQRYCFIYATKNKAQNIYRFVSAAKNGCATPSEVVGLLNSNHCFISTAAFGSEMAPEVSVFRKFRDQFLLKNYFGKKFVKYYYLYSPPAAAVIAESEALRLIARTFLYPFLAFSMIALKYGFLVALLALTVVLILLSRVYNYAFKHQKILLIFILMLGLNLKAEDEVGYKKVKHPGAAEGLVKIRKDGSYIYDMKYELKHQSSHLRFGQASNPDVSVTIETTDAAGQVTGERTLTFNDFYSNASKLLISYDYEWYPWINQGMLGAQLGGSFMYADGHGRLKYSQTESVEKFSFLTLPLNFGAVYRLQWKNQQMFAPYAAGGGTYVLLAEKREDQSTIHTTGGFGFYGAGGLLINLSAFNRETAFELVSEYGISNLWFSLEFRLTEVNAPAFSLASRSINGGISFDF